MKEKMIYLISGFIFGIGLVISGMTNPEKVIGFLSLTHKWDASLIFVMGGAIIITAPFFYFFKRNETSYLGFKISFLQKNYLDNKLILGSSFFGIGWGFSGLCPGPAITSLVFFEPITLIFLISMIIGILVNKFI